MLRIRGTVGDLPVDLTVELDDGDWARLGNWRASSTMRRWKVCSSCLSATAATAKACPTRRCCRCSSCWAMTTRWAGDASAGKRLLVRLRHSARVKVASGGDTPLYSWIE